MTHHAQNGVPPANQAEADPMVADQHHSQIHLHHDTHEATLTVLDALLGHRPGIAGYEPTETGAWVDWERLAAADLCTTEVAVVRLLQGTATLELLGPPPERVAGPLIAALVAICGEPNPGHDRTPARQEPRHLPPRCR